MSEATKKIIKLYVYLKDDDQYNDMYTLTRRFNNRTVKWITDFDHE